MIVRRLFVTGGALALSGLVLAGAHAAPNLGRKWYGRRLFPLIRRIPIHGAVALTFDDGPGEALDDFLTTLDRYNARATFFVVGEQVKAAPGRVRDIIDAGHEVGLHCYHHRNYLHRPPWEVVQDLDRAQATIEDATGRPITLYRPPHGMFNLATFIESGRRGWHRVYWQRQGWDWEASATPESIAAGVGVPDPGDIILLHDDDRYSAPGSWRRTLAALPRILETAKSAGMEVCSVGELLARAGDYAPPRASAARAQRTGDSYRTGRVS